MAGIHHSVPRKSRNSKNIKPNAMIVPIKDVENKMIDPRYNNAQIDNYHKKSNYVEVSYSGVTLNIDIDKVAKIIRDFQRDDT